MPKRVRPVIIVFENTERVINQIKDIFKDIRKGYFGEDYKIIVDTFQLSEESTDKIPHFIPYKKFRFTPTIKSNKRKIDVELNLLFEFLLKFDFLSDKRKYVQPIVLFALDGSNKYVFNEEQYQKFKRSYIFSDSLRAITFEGLSWLHGEHDQVINCLSNNHEELTDTFLAFGPYSCLTYAFGLMETMPKGKTDVISRPPFPKDVVVINGEVCTRQTTSRKKISKWKKEIREYNRYYNGGELV